MKARKLTSPKSVAREIKEFVLAEEQWNQHLWLSASFFDDYDMQATGTELRKLMTENVCGTQCCVAGAAVVLTLPAKAKYDYANDEVINPDGSRVFVQKYAQDKLGISREDSDWLFDSGRQRNEIIKALDLIIAGKSIRSLWDW